MRKKMNPKVKAKWLRALRSGKYKQGYYRLKLKNKFCCLGVLCDVVQKDTKLEWEKAPPFGEKFGDKFDFLPKQVRQFAGVTCSTQQVLIKKNDQHGLSFVDIANWIQENL